MSKWKIHEDDTYVQGYYRRRRNSVKKNTGNGTGSVGSLILLFIFFPFFSLGYIPELIKNKAWFLLLIIVIYLVFYCKFVIRLI
ncbi:MAG: hypothetical protein VB111_08190 [Clostridiaceae bacterium]|nr:hypothetical protein [Clostridiaceae bacterium]